MRGLWGGILSRPAYISIQTLIPIHINSHSEDTTLHDENKSPRFMYVNVQGVATFFAGHSFLKGHGCRFHALKAERLSIW